LTSIFKKDQATYVLSYLDTLGLKKGARILELGCGAGEFSANLIRRGFIVIGTDISEKMLELARKNCADIGLEGNAVFQLGDVEQLDLPDDSFDVVIAIGQIEHVSWDRWALQEIHRVLKPGGYLIMTAPNRVGLSDNSHSDHLIWNVKQLAGSVLRISRLPPPPLESRGKNFYRSTSLKRMLSRLDFAIIDSMSHGFGPLVLLGRSDRVSIKIDEVLNRYREKRIIPFLSEMGSEIIVLCQKQDKCADISRRQIFSESEKRTKQFELKHKALFIRRKSWLTKNPEYSHLDLRPLDTQAYSGKNVLVISPHPDDEIIGCGGTLIKLLEEGSIVTVIQLTDGSDTCALYNSPEHIRKTIRLKEAQVVAENLGIAELILFKEDSPHFKCTDDNVKKLSEILNRLHPKVIFVPFVNDIQPAHIVANEILSKSLASSTLHLPEVNVLSYEVWSFVLPNSFCSIDNQFDKKTKMLMKYKTAMKVNDYVHASESLNAYHAYTLLGKKGFVEVFLALDAKLYGELIRSTQLS
jgi:ubiquinone/menaquinone biosynthesis C-methylase UbiE/LmbE family N-acetylglucosaminyl deacetylase